MYRLLGRWLVIVLFGFALCFVTTWVADWAIFQLRGKPASTITVHRYMGVPLKGQKTEFDFLGDFAVPCSISLFPQSGHDPCWYLSRHANQWENL